MLSDKEALKQLRKKTDDFPNTLVVLGSGWNKIIESVKIETRLDYQKLFGVKTTVPGHTGELIIANYSGKRIAFMSGRFHMYEGYSAYEATTPIRVFAKAGLKNLILTAACGALNEKYQVGDFVVLSDLITLFMALDNPLIGPKFIDASEIFSSHLKRNALTIAHQLKLSVHEGIYVYYHGPNYETPADKMALKFLGADVCGMSIVAETLVARSLNINVLGLTYVTNLAFVKHDHREVVAQANRASLKMTQLLTAIIKSI